MIPIDISIVLTGYSAAVELPVASTASDFMDAGHKSSLVEQANFAACFALVLLMLGPILGPGRLQHLLHHHLGRLRRRPVALPCCGLLLLGSPALAFLPMFAYRRRVTQLSGFPLPEGSFATPLEPSLSLLLRCGLQLHDFPLDCQSLSLCSLGDSLLHFLEHLWSNSPKASATPAATHFRPYWLIPVIILHLRRRRADQVEGLRQHPLCFLHLRAGVRLQYFQAIPAALHLDFALRWHPFH